MRTFSEVKVEKFLRTLPKISSHSRKYFDIQGSPYRRAPGLAFSDITYREWREKEIEVERVSLRSVDRQLMG